MENSGEGITMNAGVASTIKSRNVVEFPKNRAISSIKNSSEAKSEAVSASEKVQGYKVPDNIIDFKPRKKANAGIANDLFDSAKSDGVDCALEGFIKGKFD